MSKESSPKTVCFWSVRGIKDVWLGKRSAGFMGGGAIGRFRVPQFQFLCASASFRESFGTKRSCQNPRSGDFVPNPFPTPPFAVDGGMGVSLSGYHRPEAWLRLAWAETGAGARSVPVCSSGASRGCVAVTIELCELGRRFPKHIDH